MAYMRNGMVARRGPSDLSGIWDKLWSTLKSGGGKAVDYYTQAQKDAGAAAALAQQQAQPVAVKSGISTGTALLIGGGVLGAVLLLRK